MNEQAAHQASIEKWMLSILRDGGVERYDDLHVDRVDGRWRARECWIEAALEVFPCALGLRDSHQLEVTVALAFSLLSSPRPQGANFGTANELLSLLDWSPPSLYLFHFGQEPWLRVGIQALKDAAIADMRVLPIEASQVLGAPISGVGRLLEFKRSTLNEYNRTFYVAG
jgi:hypothetical protein